MIKKKYDTVDFIFSFELNGAVLTLPYTTPNEAYSDETKGKVTLTVQKTDGTIKSDAGGTPIDHVPVFANGSVYSQGTCNIAPGFDTEEQLIWTLWYHKKSGSTLLKRSLKIGYLKIEGGVQASAPS